MNTEDWERTLELADELSQDELGALLPEIQKALLTSEEKMLESRIATSADRRLQIVLGRLLARIERRLGGETFQ